MHVLFIGGSFDDQNGKKSSYIDKFSNGLRGVIESPWTIVNGGSWSLLEEFANNEAMMKVTDIVFWMPNVPNDKPKLINKIKELNPKLMLVTSKNNMSGNYTKLDLVARALSAKANLLIEFTKNNEGNICGTILDPLANTFISNENDIKKLTAVLGNRILQLRNFTRIPSKSIGEKISGPEEKEFFKLVQEYAEKFHTLTHAINQDRMLGNISFRCENGFPSMRKDNLVFVSRRNVDKRDLDHNGVVAVNANNINCIEFYGDRKPSVDTPIQVRLYNKYPNVKYMLHSHTYIKDAPFTHSIVPCGAIEEFDEILKLYPDENAFNFFVNLKGHGSLVLARDIEFMHNISYVSRNEYDN